MAAPMPPPIRKALKLPGLWISGISGWGISESITTCLMEPRSGCAPCAPALPQQNTETATAARAERICDRVILASLPPNLAEPAKLRREVVHGQPELFVAHVDDLVALEAAGSLHLDDLAGLFADEGAADGRVVGDAAGLDVGLVLADDLPGGGLAVALDVDGGAEHAAAFRIDQLRVDDLRVGELGLDV